MEENIDLNLYHIFYVVANVGNITKASELLYVSQPAVSKSIQQLEKMLGGKLFFRTQKGVHLTEEGNVLYQYVKQGLEVFSNAKNKFNSLMHLEEGKIKIGASATVTKFFLMPYIELFHKNYPNIDISITNELTIHLKNDLRNGKIDILVANLPMEKEADLEITPCALSQDFFACSEKFLKRKDRKLTLKELLSYPIITQKEPSNTREFLNEFMKSHQIDFKPDIEIVSYALVVEFIKAGFGIGYVTKEFIQKELEEGSLYEVKLEEEIPSRQIGMVTLKNNVLNFAAQQFSSLIKKGIKH